MVEKTLNERWKAKTPKFWKKVQRIGIAAGALGAILLASPIALPVVILTGASYLIALGSATATLSQLTIDNNPEETFENK